MLAGQGPGVRSRRGIWGTDDLGRCDIAFGLVPRLKAADTALKPR
jgi:hypothetical protein